MKADNGHHDTHYYNALTRRMIGIIIVVSITPMLLVAGVIYSQFHDSYKEKVYAHLGELVLKHRQNIDNFLTEKLNNIRFMAEALDVEELNNERVLREKLKILQEEYGTVFEDLGFVNHEGLQVAYAGSLKLENARYSGAEWFLKALENEYYISDVFMGLRGFPHFIVTVRGGTDEEPWVLRATINFMAFNALVQKIRIGKTGFAFILNRQGQYQTEPAFDALPSIQQYSEYFLTRNPSSHSNVRIMEKEDSAGRVNLYVGALLKGGDWLMVYQQHSEDAYADLQHAQKIIILILLVGIIGIVTMSVLLSGRMVSRMSFIDREKEMMNQQVIETGKLASVGQLAAGIAHEINNPVAIMVEEAGWIQDLLEEEEFAAGKNLEEFQRALLQIGTQGRRCKEITHKLLSFARKTDSRIHDVRVNEMIDELVELSAQRARYAGVEIITRFQKDLPLLKVSETEFQQVMLNLINNALDAMEKKGGLLKISTSLEGEEMVIEVADNGPGIPKSNLARIFDPFFTTKPVGKGTGLGLSICYGIVKKMGGEVDVKSVMDHGTTFHIRLPVIQD